MASEEQAALTRMTVPCGSFKSLGSSISLRGCGGKVSGYRKSLNTGSCCDTLGGGSWPAHFYLSVPGTSQGQWHLTYCCVWPDLHES